MRFSDLDLSALCWLLDVAVPAVVCLSLGAAVLLMVSIGRDLKRARQWFEQF